MNITKKVLGVFFVALIGLVVLGFIYQSVQQSKDRADFPVPFVYENTNRLFLRVGDLRRLRGRPNDTWLASRDSPSESERLLALKKSRLAKPKRGAT